MSMVQAGTFSLQESSATETNGGDTSTFSQINFPTPFPEDARVVVLPLTQTFNGPHTPGLRVHDVTNTGFKIRMNEIYSAGVIGDGVHTWETIGWIAVTV